LTIRIPLITGTPNREMNPIAAEMLKSKPETSPKIPPHTANGIPTIRLSRRELNNSSTTMRMSVIGTMIRGVF
jgi:hypothetical protein